MLAIMTACRLLAATLSLPMGEAVRTDCFRSPSGDIPADVAWAEVARTDEALVVRIGRRLADGERPRACGKAMPPESMFANGGETVELLLAPHADDPSAYYHFIANPSNVLYMAKRRDAAWRPKVPVATRPFFERRRWGVEFSLPYAAFGIGSPKDGDRWGANFASRSCSWSGARDFHDRSKFGTLAFGGARSAVVESVVRDEDGTVHVSFAIPPERKRGEIPHKADGFACDYALSDGGRSIAGFRTRVEGHDAGYLVLDRYYYPAGEPFVLAYSAKEVGVATVRVRCLQDDKVYGERQGLPPSGKMDVGSLPPGDYAFEIDDGIGHAACQFEVRDTNRPMRTDGPHYPLVGSEALPSEVLAFRHALAKRFVQLPVMGYAYDGTVRLANPSDDDRTVYRLAYEAQMAVLTNDAATGGLKVVADGPGFYRAAYRNLKARYPNHRFSIHVDGGTHAGEYAGACDIFEYAAPACSYARDLLRDLGKAVDDMREVAGGRPALLWLGVAVPDNGRSRSADELNAAVRYCILKGAAGNVFHLGHGGIPASNARLWSWLRGCERAVNDWYPDWANGADETVRAEAAEDISYGMRVRGNRHVLIAVNFSRFGRTLSYEDPVTRERRRVRLPGCASAVVVMEHP